MIEFIKKLIIGKEILKLKEKLRKSELKMNKIAKKWQITIVKIDMIDVSHSVELSHNQTKTTWYVTFEGDFYTEFTFKNKEDAEKMYNASLNSELYMDEVAK